MTDLFQHTDWSATMAWSDRARAAAAEARRLHAKQSGVAQDAARAARTFKSSLMGRPAYRNTLAHTIRAMRKGFEGHARYWPLQDAVASTAYRNALRKGKK